MQQPISEISPSHAVNEIDRLAKGDRSHLVAWALHVPGVGMVLLWAVGVCAIPLEEYILLYAYPGLALTVLTLRPIVERLGAVPLDGMTPKLIEGVYDAVRDSGRAEKTVLNVHRVLKKALSDAVSQRDRSRCDATAPARTTRPASRTTTASANARTSSASCVT